MSCRDKWRARRATGARAAAVVNTACATLACIGGKLKYPRSLCMRLVTVAVAQPRLINKATSPSSPRADARNYKRIWKARCVGLIERAVDPGERVRLSLGGRVARDRLKVCA